MTFRADRVDRLDVGPLLTDYKSGKPVYSAVDPEKRRKSLLDATAEG